jgi:hypothetical protein
MTLFDKEDHNSAAWENTIKVSWVVALSPYAIWTMSDLSFSMGTSMLATMTIVGLLSSGWEKHSEVKRILLPLCISVGPALLWLFVIFIYFFTSPHSEDY